MNRKSIIYLSAFIGLTIILILAIMNARNSKSLKAEKLISRTAITEKSVLENDLARTRADYASLKQLKEKSDALLKEVEAKLAEAENRIGILVRDNRSLNSDRKELAALKEVRKELESQIANLNSEREKLLEEGRNYQATINNLEKEKNQLTEKLEKSNLYRTDNFLATATRGKKAERLVIKAARAKKLNLTFEVPGNLAENLSFKIVTPDGRLITSEDSNLSWNYQAAERNITASLSPATGEFVESKPVVLTYNAKEKLAKGEYKIQILTNNNSIGTCRLMVR